MLTGSFSTPFYEGSGLSALVPNKYDVAINGRTFMLDWKNTYTGVGRFVRQSIELLKPQQDSSGNVSEQSLNPEEFARRAQESWHHGAGQSRLDRPDSDPYRFRTSKGIDVWNKWEATLLNAVAADRTSGNPNVFLVVAGARLYMTDGLNLRYTTDLSGSWSAATGTSSEPAQGIATDGFNVYTTHGTDGVYKTDTSASSTASYNTRHAAGICAYVKGRLIVSNDNVLVNITGTGTEKIILTHPTSSFRWVGAADGPAYIYAAGYSGDKSVIYKTSIKADGTDLEICTVAGELPDGEIVRSIQGYLGMILVGTDSGVRVFQLDTNGNLAGSSRVIPTPAAVYCFEPQDRFVWYGLTTFDSTSSGLGRLDLSEFTDTLTPAYASDLMTSSLSPGTPGVVLSAVTFGGIRVFSVTPYGLFKENAAAKVSTGYVDSGLVGYGLPDTKVSIYLDVRLLPWPTGTMSVTAAISADGGAFTTIGATPAAFPVGATTFGTQAGEERAETFEVRLTLTTNTATATAFPTVTRWTLEANPAPGRGEFFDVPLLLWETVTDVNDARIEGLDPRADYAALLSMEALGEPVTYQDCLGASIVTLENHTFLVDSRTTDRRAYNGTFVARLKRPRQRS